MSKILFSSMTFCLIFSGGLSTLYLDSKAPDPANDLNGFREQIFAKQLQLKSVLSKIDSISKSVDTKFQVLDHFLQKRIDLHENLRRLLTKSSLYQAVGEEIEKLKKHI